MTRILLGVAGVSILLLAAPLNTAGAADMPLKAPPPPPPALNWTGCNVNAGVGYGMWNQDQYSETFPVLFPISTTTTDGGRGWLGRFGAGCDYQFGAGRSNFVIGAFGDYDVMNLHGSNQPESIFFGGAPVSGTETETGAWAFGGRIGYLVTPWLLSYFSGGYTQARFGQVNLTTTTVPGGPTTGDFPAEIYRGWFIGGGTEYALNFDWIPVRGLFWRSEYRFAQYQAVDLPLLITATGAPVGFAEHSQKEVQTITTSLVWRFNWAGGPIATRY
jgi:outer membrane immunogenic protein